MSLRLLIDEDTQDARLVSSLQAAGYDVLTVNQAGLSGQSDVAVLDYATQEHRIVLTMNCRDFLELHAAGNVHQGIVGIYKDRNPRKDMTFEEIAFALANLTTSGWDIAGQFVILNAWKF